MTKRRKWSLAVFILVILLCVMGYIPWDSTDRAGSGTASDYVNGLQNAVMDSFIGQLLGIDKFTEFGGWYFIEF